MSVQNIVPVLKQFVGWPNQFDDRDIRVWGTTVNRVVGVLGVPPAIVTGAMSAELIAQHTPAAILNNVGFFLDIALGLEYASGGPVSYGVWLNEIMVPTGRLFYSSPSYLPIHDKHCSLYINNSTGATIYYMFVYRYLPRNIYNPDIGSQTDTPMELGK